MHNNVWNPRHISQLLSPQPNATAHSPPVVLNNYITHLNGGGPLGHLDHMDGPQDQGKNHWVSWTFFCNIINHNYYKRVKAKPLNKSLATIHSQTNSLRTIHKFYPLFPLPTASWLGGHLPPPPFLLCWRCSLPMCWRQSLHQRRLFLLLLADKHKIHKIYISTCLQVQMSHIIVHTVHT